MSWKYNALPDTGDSPLPRYNDQIEDEISILDPMSIENENEQEDIPDINILGGTSNLKHAFFNMTNSIVGAGIVGIPMAFLNSGLLMGTILMIILTFMNDWTLRLIVVNTKLSGSKTYTGCISHTYGNFGKIVVLFSQGFFAVGGSIGFTIIIGDSIPHILRSVFSEQVKESALLSFLLSRNFIITFCICFICFPLSLIRDISLLARASGLALISMFMIISIVIFKAPFVDEIYKGSISNREYIFNTNIFQGISVISFALVCHHNTTFIYDSIKVPTLDRFNRIIHYSCAISGFLCALLGICGFMNFGDKTKGNILNNFPNNDWLINIARFCFGLNMITTLPLEIYVIREVIKDLYTIFKRRKEPSFEAQNFTTFQHAFVTSILLLIPLGVSIMTCNLGAVLEIVGATSGSLLAYILPPLCYNKMTKGNKSKLQQSPYYVCATFGFMVMILSTFQTISQSMNSSSGTNHCAE